MSANKKVILIVILGVGACLLSFLLSRYFLEKGHANQLVLSHIQQATARIEHIRLLGKSFIQNADQASWLQIIQNMESVRLNLGTTPHVAKQWRQEIEVLNHSLETYHGILTQLYEPAVNLKAHKAALQGIGLSFSKEVEEKIIRPYRKEEGLRIYEGAPVDPFKGRVKDTAYDLLTMHIKQQLILLELLLGSDLEAYREKKQDLSNALAKHKAQLRYMSVLMGSAPLIQSTIESLDRKLTDLVRHEQAILDYFTTLSENDARLSESGEALLAASRALSKKIVLDVQHTNRLNRLLSWSLLLGIVCVLGLLGAMLARDIIHFVQDLKQTQEELRESENNLMVTLYSIGDAFIATDADSVITRINPPAEELTGWQSAEAIGKPLQEVFHIVNARTRQKVANPVESVLANGETVGLANHTLLIARDGTERQIADSGAPIRRADGRAIGVVLVFRDVTETYAQEQKIRESEKLLKNVTANVPGVVFELQATSDHEYTLRFINEKVVDIFGLDVPSEGFIAAFSACIAEDEKDRFLASIRDAVDLVRPWHYEGCFVKPSGEHMWFSGIAIPYKEGESIVFDGVLMDITERKHWESALEASESRYRDLFNEAPLMYVITENRHGEPFIRDANNLFLGVLGYSREDVLGTPLAEYYTDDSKEDLLERGGYGRSLKGRISEERTFLTRDGQMVHTLLHALPEIDAHGRVVGTRAMFLDITARKHAEQEKRRLEAALVQSQKMEAIGTLAGGIAHDFNNILSAVIGYAELALNDTKADSRIHENLQQIHVAGMRAGALVRQILTFSRRTERELKPIQIGPLVQEALKLLRSSLPTTIEISQHIASDLDNVMADPTQLHQILMNLCTNAAQAMEEDGGHLTIGLLQVELTPQDLPLHPDLKSGRYLKLSIQDTGKGIPSNIQEQIFLPYFTTKEKGKGTGLGLSVVHGIVQSYGGAVYVYSEPNQGTTFNVYVPAISRKPLMEEEKLSALPTGSEHILFVDDEPTLVKLGVQMLEKLGYRVSTANGGIEALKMFGDAPQAFDLVLTDMTMPKMTGDKLAVELIQRRPDIPVILSTGYSSAINSEKVVGIGIKALIEKPIVLADLAKTVRKVLDDAGKAE